MALPQDLKKQVQKRLWAYCQHRVPPSAREQVKVDYGIRGNFVTLFEERPHFTLPQWVRMKIAQFRYDPETDAWTLFWPDRNERWHEYFDLPPSVDLDDLLVEVDEDPTGIFWG